MKTTNVIKVAKVLSWILFIGFCIKAGAILYTFLLSLLKTPQASENLYAGLDLSAILDAGSLYYSAFVVLLLVVTLMQAYIFFQVLKLFRNFNEAKPFSKEISGLISNISYVCLGAGLLAGIGARYSQWLLGKGITVTYTWTAQELLFMAGVLLVIGLLFKRGIEIQTENELTI